MGFFLRLFVYGTAISVVTLAALSVLSMLDLNKVIHNNTPGSCHLISGIEHGSEDLDVLPNGLAIFSTGLSFTKSFDHVTPDKAAIMLLNISTPDQPAIKLKLNGFRGSLNPHGISIFLQSGKTYVYVINHPPFNQHPPADTVEKFQLDAEKRELNHERSFADPEFVGLNDLVVVGMDKFYASNFQTFKSNFWREYEQFFYFIPAQNVIYYDGSKASIVLPAMYGSNGIDVSSDKKYLFLSEVNKKRINSFRIESATKLVLHDRKDLDTIPDNINVDHRSGDLWIGCHPSLIQLFRRQTNPMAGYVSPSQVLRISTKDGKFGTSHEMFADNGHQLVGSSSAAYHKGENAFVIGTVEHKAMYCKCDTCPK